MHVLKLDARTLKEAMDEFPDIKRDMQELARRRVMAGAQNDPTFQLQLFDFKSQMNVVIESLKKTNEAPQLQLNEVREDSNEDQATAREDLKIVLPDASRERRNGPLMEAMAEIDFEQL